MNRRGMRPPWNRRLWAARRRWLVVATAAGSILVMALSAALQAFLGQLNRNIATESMTVLGKLPPPSKAGVLSIPRDLIVYRPSCRERVGGGSAGTDPAGGGSGPGVQTRNASQDICSGLPKPNNLGELGR